MNAREIMNNALAQAKADWVKSMTEDFYADEKKNPTEIGAVGLGNTIIVVYGDSVETSLVGVAKCNPNDRYDREIGIAIAYSRAIGQPIPDYVLDDCSISDEDEDDGYDEDYVEFGEIGVGGKFIDDGDLFIKVNDDKAYRYEDKRTIDFDEGYVVDTIVTD